MSQRWITARRFEDDLIPRFLQSMLNWDQQSDVTADSFLRRRHILPDFRLDTHENEREYIVSADLPGVKKEDIKISVKDGMLNMEAERKHDTDIGNEDSHYVERVYGHVQRSIKLPRTADESQIKCTFQNGVLNVTIAKRDNGNGNGGYLPIE